MADLHRDESPASSVGANPRESSIAKRVAVLTISCDKYADLWGPHFELLQRFWPDCPFPRYLGANARDFTAEGVTVLKVGPDISWSDNLLVMLNRIPEEYVLLLLDDFFMWSKIDSNQILRLALRFDQLQGGCLRLVPRPGPDRVVDRCDGFGELAEGAPYRVSTQGALWRRDHLRAILKPGESIWQFEIEGSRRSQCRELSYYATAKPALTYGHHVVQRGKWFPWYLKRLRKLKISYDNRLRPSLSAVELLIWFSRKAYGLFR